MGFASAVKAGQTAIELGQTAQNFRAADKKDLGRQAGRTAFTEGANVGTTAGKSWLKTFEVIPRVVCRSLQFLFAIIACGFYGNRVDADRRADDGFSPEWVFALVVAGASALTAVFYMALTPLGAIPYFGSRLKMLKTYRAFAWDLVLFICWIVVFAIFAGIFLKRDSGDEDDVYKGSSTRAMKSAVWIDFMNSLFWLTSGVYGAIKVFLGERITRATGRVSNKLFDKKEPKDPNYAESV
jgi:preprotein translocase subunit SecG